MGFQFSNDEAVNYEVDIMKNNTLISSGIGVIVGKENTPIFRFSVPNSCKMRIKIDMNVTQITVAIYTKAVQIYSGKSKEFIFDFPSKGTYAIFLYPN